MASQGPLSVGTGANDTAVGTTAWATPGNITASDDTRTSADPGTLGVSNYLKGTNPGFSVPAGATINGIVVEIERRVTGAVVATDNRVRIVKGGTIGATDRASASNWPTIEAYATYGSASDLWGETWTSTDINASTFGVALSSVTTSGNDIHQVDHIRITVYYTAAISQLVMMP